MSALCHERVTWPIDASQGGVARGKAGRQMASARVSVERGVVGFWLDYACAHIWRAGASQPSRFNGRFFSLYIYLYISGAGRHHTVMFYVILNTRTNVKFHKSSTKLHVFEVRLFGFS